MTARSENMMDGWEEEDERKKDVLGGGEWKQ
jgi:hypothetical protein